MGTLGKSNSDRKRDREECDHWLAGSVGVLQVDIEWGDGTRSVLWTEQSPNSILSSYPIGLYKGEESIKPTLSYIMNTVDSEVGFLGKSFLELSSSVSVTQHVIDQHQLVQTQQENLISDVNANIVNNELAPFIIDTVDNDNIKVYDDVVKPEFLGRFSEVDPSIDMTGDVKQVEVLQRFSVRVSSTTAEKFDRNLRGKAGAGSWRPCVLCSLTWSECLCEENFGPLQVELTNTLEREAADFCLDNPLELKRKDLDDLSLGMKRIRLTEIEVSTDIPDSLHLHINVSGSFMYKIACRIFCFGGDDYPVFHWEKTAGVKEKIQQAEVGYARCLQKFISSLPSLNQMPGNFGRAFIDKKNRNAVLEPLPDCTAKEVFTEILDLWEQMCSSP